MKYRGVPVEPPAPHGFEVKVLGRGCPNCKRLEQMVRNLMPKELTIFDWFADYSDPPAGPPKE
jgi:hypothetical protein